MDIASIFGVIAKNPMTIFLLVAIAAGYAYWEQNKRYVDIVAEVGMLRAELKKTNEIIKLKVDLAEALAKRCE
jgi:hypothetical protein